MSIGLIVGALVLTAIVGVVALGVRKSRAHTAALSACLRSLGLQQTQGSPLAASGTIEGLPVTYEQANFRTAGTRGGFAQGVRIRVTAPAAGRPDTALIGRRWDVVGVSRPTGMRVVPTGDGDIDRRFEAFVTDDAGLAVWAGALSHLTLGEVLRYEGVGRVREATIYGGQVTLVAVRELSVDRQRRLVQAAVELAKMSTQRRGE